MSHQALIIEHDPLAMDMVVEVLESLGHEFDTAGSQREAIRHIKANEYAYVLLDIEIPARTATGLPRIQNAENFLEQLASLKDGNCPPVVIMTGHTAADTALLVKMMRLAAGLREKGATDFIGKPFPPAGRTLDRVIKKVLAGKKTPVRITWPKDIPKAKRSTSKAKAAQPPGSRQPGDRSRWAGIPNEPIDLNAFMMKFCAPRSKESRKCRKRALLAAARHGTLTLPPLVGPRKQGRANHYFTHDLLAAWQNFLAEGLDVPPLLAPTRLD